MSVITSMTAKPPRWQHSISHTIQPFQNPLPSATATFKVVLPLQCKCKVSHNDRRNTNAEPSSTNPEWLKRCLTAAVAAAVISTGMNAEADLNKYEAETRGEFGIGSAAQFGSADLRKSVHSNENFRRANFTSADMRECDFSGSTFNGAYLEKAVAYKTNFTDWCSASAHFKRPIARQMNAMENSIEICADLSDTLMDRMVLNEANLTNAILARTVLTRSDLGGAIIEGADFSDAVLDLPQKQALCKYASGTNPVTGISTRKSLGCGNTRRNAYGSPSAPLLSAPPEKLLDRDGFCDSATGLCDAASSK